MEEEVFEGIVVIGFATAFLIGVFTFLRRRNRDAAERRRQAQAHRGEGRGESMDHL